MIGASTCTSLDLSAFTAALSSAKYFTTTVGVLGWAPQYSGLAFNVIELFGVNCSTTYGPEPTACVFATYFASLSNTSPARPVSAHSRLA